MSKTDPLKLAQAAEANAEIYAAKGEFGKFVQATLRAADFYEQAGKGFNASTRRKALAEYADEMVAA